MIDRARLQQLCNRTPRLGPRWPKSDPKALDRIERIIAAEARQAVADCRCETFAEVMSSRARADAERIARLAARPFHARLADWWRARPWR